MSKLGQKYNKYTSLGLKGHENAIIVTSLFSSRSDKEFVISLSSKPLNDVFFIFRLLFSYTKLLLICSPTAGSLLRDLLMLTQQLYLLQNSPSHPLVILRMETVSYFNKINK